MYQHVYIVCMSQWLLNLYNGDQAKEHNLLRTARAHAWASVVDPFSGSHEATRQEFYFFKPVSDLGCIGPCPCALRGCTEPAEILLAIRDAPIIYALKSA